MRPPASKTLAPELALHPQSCVFRRSVFDKVGLFETAFKYTADWDSFMRAIPSCSTSSSRSLPSATNAAR